MYYGPKVTYFFSGPGVPPHPSKAIGIAVVEYPLNFLGLCASIVSVVE